MDSVLLLCKNGRFLGSIWLGEIEMSLL